MQSSPWRSLLLLCALAAAGCASPTLARVAPGLSTAPRPFFIRIADALTAPSLTEEMRVAPRALSPYQLSAACRTPHRIARLEAPSRTVDLRPGERLTLSTLRIVAVNDANIAVPDVPVSIEVEERAPSAVQVRSDDPDIDAGRVLAVAEGTFRLRVRTICVNEVRELIITGRVTP